MTDLNIAVRNRTAYLLILVGYGFLVSVTVMLHPLLTAGVLFLSLQCMAAIFAASIFLADRTGEAKWPGRIARRLKNLLYPLGILSFGTIAALLSSFVAPLPFLTILLLGLFSLSFCLFLAGVILGARALCGQFLSQAIVLGSGLLMISTPYYVNPFILSTSGALRMLVVQWAININPLLIGSAGIMRFDWLRAPSLYDRCLIGGYQYPFYYPSPLKVGIILALAGIILIGLSAIRENNDKLQNN